MKALAFLGVLLFAATAVAADEPAPVVVDHLPTSLGGDWWFRVGHDPGWASPFRERRNWERIHAPGAWERFGHAGYDGHAWYRLSLLISSELAGEQIGIDLGTVGDADEVFFNGRRVGGTGAFPPRFDKATLARRFYQIPRDAVRFGEYNELAVHVYNDVRFGGLLGPTPTLDRYESILARLVLRDVLAYSLVTLLGTLALLHLVLFLAQRNCPEHLSFAAFLTATGVYFVTYVHWGPALLFGHNANFRLNVVSLLAAVILFPLGIYRLAHRHLSVVVVAIQTLLAIGGAFAIAWREEGDLYFWVYLGEAAAVLILAAVFWILLNLVRHRHPWGVSLLVTTALFAVLVIVDVSVDVLGLVRPALIGELFSPFGLIPLAVVMSFALGHNWVERRWGEPLDYTTGLMARDRFVDRLTAELERSRRTGTPVTAALLRLTFTDSSVDISELTSLVVGALRRALRQSDLLARYDRETFAILLADTEERSAMATLERLRRAVVENLPPAARRVRTAAGVAQYRPHRHVAAAELLAESESALYAATAEGGDHIATAP